MTTEEFAKWYEQNEPEIKKELEYKGLLGGLYFAFEMGREQGKLEIMQGKLK